MGSVMARTAGAGLALCIGALCANGAMAQSQRPSTGKLGDMLFESNGRKSAIPPVARFVAEDSVAFTFDRSSAVPMIRFEGSKEIWVLFPQYGPNNDIIYKNDVGEPVLRVHKLGGTTVFTATRPEGAAAFLNGGGTSLRASGLANPFVLARLLEAASSKVSTAARRQIGIYADELGPESAVEAVDAVNVAAEAFVKLARAESNSAALAKIGRVVLLEGEKPAVSVSQRALVITIVPGRGVAGRPSSAKIVKELKR